MAILYGAITGLCVSILFAILLYIYAKKKNTTIGILNNKYEKLSAKVDKVTETIQTSEIHLSNIRKDIEIAKEQRKNAIELANYECEKQKLKLNDQLNKELEEFKKEHSLTGYRLIVEQLQSQIKQKKEELLSIQKSQRQKEDAENFFKTHSISLTAVDRNDIALLREFAPKLVYKEVLLKLIWSQYYQGKLQILRKSLNADKITGIYKITDKDGRSYIGQSVDIGSRWADHVKCGLGIGVGTLNKFYSAMNEKGPESFTFEIIEECPKESLNEREKYWIDFYNSISFGYNIKVGG